MIATDIRNVAVRKLDLINAASLLEDLKVPPGNQLEVLRGDLEGFHSIRINQQWRIIFMCVDGGAENFQIIDYHR